MRISDYAICKVCHDVFCCAECRQKHEIKNHSIVVPKASTMSRETQNSVDVENVNGEKALFEQIYLFCPICEDRPLILQAELHYEMLLHIELCHLPLRCRKCFKIYNKINDLQEFSKCVYPTVVCQSQEPLACNQSCFTDDASKITVTKSGMPHSVISQKSPLGRQDFNDSHMTPISIINMRWKAKSKLTHDELISDSVSSIKNISSINNSSIRRSAEMASAAKGKVIRCSSTPVHLEMVFAKPKEQTFNATGGGHMSSIQYTSGCESDNSPAFLQPNSQSLDPVNRYIKVTESRPRMSAVTPLRQVMSKSIQKAFAEHGLPASTTVRGPNAFQRKNMFNSTSSPEINEKQSPQQPPLDLRLSPAVRRSQSKDENFLKNQIFSNQQKENNELRNIRCEILLSAQKLTTESIVITRTEHLSGVSSSTSAASSNYSMNSVKPYSRSTNSSYQSARSNNTGGSMFKSCSSVEIITATTEEIQQLHSIDEKNARNSVIPPLTPITRIPGVIHKKIIKFETPKIESCESREFQNSPNDAFFTPNATPIRNDSESVSIETKQRQLLVKQNLSGRFSPLRRPSIRECTHSDVFSRKENIANDFTDIHNIGGEDGKVFLPQESEKPSQNVDHVKKEDKTMKPRGLWSLMSSVIRLPSRKGSNSKESCNNEQYALVGSSSIIKRCASIAGSLVGAKSLVDETELSSLKRKRTYTTDNQSTAAYLAEFNNPKATSPMSEYNTSSKRFRIQGRQPIDRMRLTS